MRSLGSEHVVIHDLGTVPFLTLLVICLVLGGLLLSEFISPGHVFGIMALVMSIVMVLTRWPHGALLTIMVASVMPHLSVEVGGWNARPEHYALMLVSVAFVTRWAFGQRPRLSLTGADWFVIAYIVANYASSAWMSPDPKQTLRWALLNNLVIMPYFLIRFLVTNERILRWAFSAFLAVGVIESAYALVCFISHHLFGTSFGVNVGQYTLGFAGIYATQYEPNLLGSYSACLALMLIVLYFAGKRRPTWLALGIIAAMSAMVVSLARVPLLSFLTVLFFMALLGLRAGVFRAERVLPLILGLVLFVPIVITGGSNLGQRFAELKDGGLYHDDEAMSRLVALAVAAVDISQHPLAGNGTASFQVLADARQLPILGDRPWVGNGMVRILHDTGLCGLLLFVLISIRLGKQAKKALGRQGTQRAMVISLCAGCFVYALAFMATDGTILAFFWVHLGILASATTMDERGTAEGAQRSEGSLPPRLFGLKPSCGT